MSHGACNNSALPGVVPAMCLLRFIVCAARPISVLNSALEACVSTPALLGSCETQTHTRTHALPHLTQYTQTSTDTFTNLTTIKTLTETQTHSDTDTQTHTDTQDTDTQTVPGAIDERVGVDRQNRARNETVPVGQA